MARGKLLVIVLVGVLLAGCGGQAAARQEAMAEAANQAKRKDYMAAIWALEEFAGDEEVDPLLREYHLLYAKRMAEWPSRIWEAYEALDYFAGDPSYEAYLDEVVDVLISRLHKSDYLYMNLTFLEGLERNAAYQEVFDEYWVQAGIQELENGEFENARDAFSHCGEEAQGHLKKVEFVEGLRGTWTASEQREMIINGTAMTSVLEIDRDIFLIDSIIDFNTIAHDAFMDYEQHLYTIDEDGGISRSDRQAIYTKTSDSVKIPEQVYRPAPAVGMTAEEVRASYWGKPEKVNTTVTAGGTREQWVYGDGRYIYFENGVVTTIQY